MNRCRPLFLVSCVIVLSGMLLGCGSSDESSAWTVDEGDLELEQDLFVGETENFYFGSITDLAVTSGGRMYVLDWDARHIKVLGPDGTPGDTIGREGEGPGEFQRPGGLVVARGDSVYVLDSGTDRVSVFAPEGSFAYSTQAESGATPGRLMVPAAERGFVLTHSSPASPGSSNGGSFTVRRIYPSERPADTILVGKPRPWISEQRGEITLFYTIPYERRPYAALGPEDQVHYGQTDSLKLTVHELDGTQSGSLAIPFEPVPVTDERRETMLKNMSSQRRSALEGHLPSTKPAFDQLLLDDAGRYWFKRRTADPDTAAWWVADPDENRVVTTRLPRHVRILAVQDGFAYAETETEAGAPALARYRVQIIE